MQEIIDLIQKRKYVEADEVCDKYLATSPADPTLYHLKALIALRQNQYARGITLLKEAIALNPSCADYFSDLGVLYLKAKETIKAKEALRQAIEIDPYHHTAQYNLASIYTVEGSYPSALIVYKNLVNTFEADEQLLFNYAFTLHKCGNYKEALNQYQEVLYLNPYNSQAINNIGLIYLSIKNFEKAHKYFFRCTAFDPEFPDPILGLAQIAIIQEDYPKALENLEHALSICIDDWVLRCKAMVLKCFSLQQLLEFDALEEEIHLLNNLIIKNNIREEELYIDPFPILTLPLEPLIKCQVAEEKANSLIKSLEVRPLWTVPANERYHNTEKVYTIAYISPDLREHAVGMLIRDYFKFHDRNKFKVIGIHLNSIVDEITDRIAENCDEFYQVDTLSDLEVANLIAEKNVDVLIDLAGYTREARPKILALKPARIQICHAIGYSYTLGGDFIDYFIADKYLIDESSKELFKEDFILTHNSCIATSNFDDYPLPQLKEKSAYGLPFTDSSFIYCCFCAPYRIDKEVFEIWTTILHRAENSVLWLYANTREYRDKIKQYCKLYNIDSDRIIFLNDNKLTNEWPHRHADLWLDTMVASSCTGLLLSAWCDLPAIVFSGQLPQSKYGASINQELQLDELIVNTNQEYIKQALDFYKNPEKLKDVKQRIASSKHTSSIFNPGIHIADIEQQLLTIIEK